MFGLCNGVLEIDVTYLSKRSHKFLHMGHKSWMNDFGLDEGLLS